MMRDGRLAHVAASREVAGTDLARADQLADDREARRVAKGLEELDVGVDQGGLRSGHISIISTIIYIDKYQYDAIESKEKINKQRSQSMDTNFAAWMIAGGPRIEILSVDREREQLRAFRENQRENHVGLIDRLRGMTRSKTAEADLAGCAA
jgi:hypothetical protein